MRKRVFGRHLSRGGGARKALFRSLVRALVISGKIETTKAKAKAVIGEVDKLVNLAQAKDSSRRISEFFGNDRKMTQQFTSLARSFTGKKGGFTRLINLTRRTGDFAEIVRLEWSEGAPDNDKEDKTAKGKKNDKEIKKKNGVVIKNKVTQKKVNRKKK